MMHPAASESWQPETPAPNLKGPHLANSRLQHPLQRAAHGGVIVHDEDDRPVAVHRGPPPRGHAPTVEVAFR